MKPKDNLIHLQLGNADLIKVIRAVGQLMSALDDVNEGVKAAALCAAFLALCEKQKIEPHTVAAATKRMMNHAKSLKGFTDFEALSLYMKEEDI